MNDLDTLGSLGLTLPSPAYLAGALLFGLLGLIAWRYGGQRQRPLTRWLGLVLMLYPYAVSDTWLLYAVGILLTGLAWRAAR